MSATANSPIILALAAAINGTRPRPKLEEAMEIFNSDGADEVCRAARRWAFNKWRNSEDECHLFVLMRHEERGTSFEEQQQEYMYRVSTQI